MARTKILKQKQTTRARGVAKGLPHATFPAIKPITPKVTVVPRRIVGPPHRMYTGWPTSTNRPSTEASGSTSESGPLHGPLPQPSFGELLYKLDLLRADTRRAQVEWERKMAELRTIHNRMIDSIGRETDEIFRELKEIILAQEAEDIQRRRVALHVDLD